MGGFDDHGAITGNWVLPSPSPRSFFSSILSDDIGLRSISEPKDESITKSEFVFPTFEGQNQSENAYEGDRGFSGSAYDQATNKSGTLTEERMGSRGGLLERRAAKAGFNAPRLNTENIRPAGISQNPNVRSPYLTIPPGLSPTTLLDSPVFLSNSLVQPSPTTGKFPFAPNGNNKSSMMFSGFLDRSKENIFDNTNESTHPLLSEFSRPAPEKNAKGNNVLSDDMPFAAVVRSAENSPPPDEQQDEDVDQRFNSDVNVNNAPSEDGYNWRKYGQKQVKGSEYPRSYYKCTHPNCPVKKKVERSHEGHITEIIYKGAHSHAKPSNRRAGIGFANSLSDMQVDMAEQGGTLGNGDQVWNNLEVTSSALLGALQVQNSSLVESIDADISSTFSNDEDEEDHATHGSVSLGYDGEGDESESKRRKVEAYAADVSGNTRAIREPRVVVQTTSEVDILDDGYRWRKYGQKVVKGNPNPRSYYKCTSTGCTVRKHVERSSHDLKSVITTYEGKHNHDVPVARNSSHINSAGPTMPSQSQAGQTQNQLNRLDSSQLQNSMAQFQRPSQSLSGSYGQAGRQQFGGLFGFGNYSNQSGLANMAMAGLGGNQGRLPVLPNYQFSGQPGQMNEMGFLLPKGEPKVEPMSEPGLNQASSSAVYQQMMMNRLPL